MNDWLLAAAASSILLVFIALLYGAYHDIKSRISPKIIWYSVVPIAAISTLCWYILAYYFDIMAAISMFLTSVCLCFFSMVMGYKMGNGGDWRALYFVSLLTPWVAIGTLILSAIFGLIHILIGYQIYGKNYTAPLMVSITLGFVVSTIAYLFIQ